MCFWFCEICLKKNGNYWWWVLKNCFDQIKLEFKVFFVFEFSDSKSLFYDTISNYAYKKIDQNETKSVFYLICVDSDCEARIALRMQSNVGEISGSHKKKCNDNSVQFYNCELMKQKIHKFAEDDTYDHLKPKEIYKMALESFTKIIIPKKFKKKLASAYPICSFSEKQS